MIGTKVRMTKRCAKWFLDHPEVYFCGGRPDIDYDQDIQTYLYVCLGGKVAGEIIIKGNQGCWGVEFETPYGKSFHYYELNRDLEVI